METDSAEQESAMRAAHAEDSLLSGPVERHDGAQDSHEAEIGRLAAVEDCCLDSGFVGMKGTI